MKIERMFSNCLEVKHICEKAGCTVLPLTREAAECVVHCLNFHQSLEKQVNCGAFRECFSVGLPVVSQLCSSYGHK